MQSKWLISQIQTFCRILNLFLNCLGPFHKDSGNWRILHNQCPFFYLLFGIRLNMPRNFPSDFKLGVGLNLLFILLFLIFLLLIILNNFKWAFRKNFFIKIPHKLLTTPIVFVQLLNKLMLLFLCKLKQSVSHWFLIDLRQNSLKVSFKIFVKSSISILDFT